MVCFRFCFSYSLLMKPRTRQKEKELVLEFEYMLCHSEFIWQQGTGFFFVSVAHGHKFNFIFIPSTLLTVLPLLQVKALYMSIAYSFLSFLSFLSFSFLSLSRSLSHTFWHINFYSPQIAYSESFSLIQLEHTLTQTHNANTFWWMNTFFLILENSLFPFDSFHSEWFDFSSPETPLNLHK